jgi:hypothetical protein
MKNETKRNRKRGKGTMKKTRQHNERTGKEEKQKEKRVAEDRNRVRTQKQSLNLHSFIHSFTPNYNLLQRA